MNRDNFYIITGGPGGGKTTLLENLTLKGYRYIPETARQIIKERLLHNLPPRPDPLTFAKEIFNKDILNFSQNAEVESPLFFDRSIMDSAWQIFNSNQHEYNLVKDQLLNNRYNKKVFITPPWKEIYQADSERDQTFEEAVEVFEHLYQWYETHNYELILLPKDTIERRIAFILAHFPRKGGK
ncbi:MAG TPA: AAA family ATPase [Puia sp.]|nr:AAA family ATPase [Puia sp.]